MKLPQIRIEGRRGRGGGYEGRSSPVSKVTLARWRTLTGQIDGGRRHVSCLADKAGALGALPILLSGDPSRSREVFTMITWKWVEIS
jgi:hypothetical protein